MVRSRFQPDCESLVALVAGQLDGLPGHFTLGMPTASKTAQEMILIEEPDSSIALLSSTLFTLVVR